MNLEDALNKAENYERECQLLREQLAALSGTQRINVEPVQRFDLRGSMLVSDDCGAWVRYDAHIAQFAEAMRVYFEKLDELSAGIQREAPAAAFTIGAERNIYYVIKQGRQLLTAREVVDVMNGVKPL